MKRVVALFFSFLLLFSISWEYEKKKYDFEELLLKVKENPNNPYFLGKLGDCYLEKGVYNKAEKLYKKCLSIEPEESRHYIRLAKLYDKIDKPEEAKSIITNASYYFDRNGEVFSTLGNIEYKLGNFSNALIAYEKALLFSDKKNKHYIYFGLGKTCRELKDYEKAKTFFIKSLQLKPYCWTYYEFGKLFLELNNYKQAIWALVNAKAFSYFQENKMKKLIWERLASAYFKYAIKLKDENKKEEAKSFLSKITNDRDLSQTDYCEKASFWLKRF